MHFYVPRVVPRSFYPEFPGGFGLVEVCHPKLSESVLLQVILVDHCLQFLLRSCSADSNERPSALASSASVGNKLTAKCFGEYGLSNTVYSLSSLRKSRFNPVGQRE